MTEQEINFIKMGLDTAKIFFSPTNDLSVYENVVKFIFENMNGLLENIRLYTIDEKGKNFREEIIYSNEGFEPGYDYIPFYQLPDKITQERKISNYVIGNNLYIMVPLTISQELIGLMELKTDCNINKSFINNIEQMANTIALGLSNYLYKKDNLGKKVYTDIVIKINNELLSINDLNDLILTFLKLTVCEFRFDRVTAFIFDEEEKNIIYHKCVCENGKEFILNEVPELPELDNNIPLNNSIYCWFPLKANSRSVGLILFDNIYSLYSIPEELIDILQILCSHLAIAIENIRLYSHLQKSAYYDKLTGLYNRRYFETILPEYDSLIPTSIIIGDVNGLKITNDVFGHHAGDQLLQVIANILHKSCRPEDIIVRWGGDEFIILLPETTNNEANEIYSKIKDSCSKKRDTKVQISISLGVATRENSSEDIRDIIKEAEDRMYRHKLLETKSFRSSLMSSLKETLIEKCNETAGHAERMVELSTKIGIKMGLMGNELDDLKLLAMLHDIGKVAIDDSILSKSASLNEGEWEKVKKHSETGYRIAQASFELSHIANDILCHHEQWNGKGYPLGKKELEIPILSRIISIVDAYDVMTHDRPYKKAVGHKEALQELQRCAGTQFDPNIVKIFCELFKE